MITFETQEDFEDAVMQVLHKRLSIDVNVASRGYGYGVVKVELKSSEGKFSYKTHKIIAKAECDFHLQ